MVKLIYYVINLKYIGEYNEKIDMINIIKSKLNNKYKNKPVKVKEIIKYYKDFSPAVRQ